MIFALFVLFLIYRSWGHLGMHEDIGIRKFLAETHESRSNGNENAEMKLRILLT